MIGAYNFTEQNWENNIINNNNNNKKYLKFKIFN